MGYKIATSHANLAQPIVGIALLILVAAAAESCTGTQAPSMPPTDALFVIRACRGSAHAPDGETFRALIHDPTVVAEADLLVGQGNRKIVTGKLARGDGGFNSPWSWHLDPSGLGFTEAALELCDGCPSFVEADLASWLHVGQFCPWSTEVIARER